MNMNVMLIGLLFVAAAIALVKVARAVYSGHRERFIDVARGRMEEVFVFVDPGKVFRLKMIGTFLIPPALWFLSGGIVLPIVAAALINFAPSQYFKWKNKRRRLQIVTQLPDVLRMLGSSLRAGTSLQIAMDIVIRETPAPLSQELGVVVREQRLGLALEDALDSMAARLKLEEVELVVAAMTIAREVGGNLAETLDQLATTLRQKATMEGKIRALTSQGKLQGWIVGSLPLFLMLVLSYMQHEAMVPLFHSLIGWLVLGIIGILEIVGYAMIRKIVTIDV